MAEDNTVALPICDVCRVEQGIGEARYRVRTGSGRSQGPFSREQVVDQLRKKLLTGTDRVTQQGDDWGQIDQHPEFLGYFVPGDPLHAALNQLREEEESRLSSRRRREVFGGAGKVLVVAALLGTPLGLYALDIDVLPDSIVDSVKGGTESTLEEMGRTITKAVDEEAAERELAEQMGLPGVEVIEQIRAEWPEAASPVDQRLALANRGMLQGTQAGVENARRELEYAVAAEDENVAALSSLAVVYSQLGDSSNGLHGRALELYNRAQALDETHIGVLRAQAGMAVVNSAWEEAEQKSRACLGAHSDDGICNWYLGHALTKLGKYEEAEEALLKAKAGMEDAPVIDLALGHAGLETHRYAEAIGPLNAFAERYPDDPGIHELLARYHREVGAWDDAIAEGLRAAELDPDSLEGRYIAGTLLLHVKGDGKASWELMKGLHDSSDIDGRNQRADVLLQMCLAATAAGDAPAATDICVELTDHSSGWAPGQLAEAWAWRLAGDNAKAEEALKLADNTSVEGWELARYHLEAGRFYNSLDRERLALFELEAAVGADPTYADAYFGNAAALLAVGNAREALALISDTWTMDWTIDTQRDPVVTIPRESVDFAAIAGLVKKEIPQGDPLSERLTATLGILEAQQCLRTGKGCSRARTNLISAVNEDDANLAIQAYLGHLAIRSERWDEAIRHYTRVLSSRTAVPVVHSLNGYAHAQKGNPEVAEQQLQMAGKHGVGVQGIARRHADALRLLDKRDEAVEMARTAIEDEQNDYVSKALLLELGQP